MGAVFFVTSDFIICYDKFIGPLPYSQPLIMSTYYAAQMGITLSVVDSQVDGFLNSTIEQSLEDCKASETQNHTAPPVSRPATPEREKVE